MTFNQPYQCPDHPNYKGVRETKRDCTECKKVYELRQLMKRNQGLEKQLSNMRQRRKIDVDKYEGDVIRFGVVSDTHLCSRFENIDFLETAYQIFKREGIKKVYHPGDILDGEKMYRGHEYEVHTVGADNQVDYCCSVYPQVDGVETHFITGNHDLAYYKRSGFDVGTRIAEKREDLIYHGQEQVDIKLENDCGSVVIRLVHPGGGTAYAISYKLQKYIESLTGGEKPNAVFVGHFHKAEWLPNYRNVQGVQAGTLQSQTPYMQRKQTPAMMGFYIVEMVIEENSIIRFNPEFFPFYEEEKFSDK